MTNHLKPNFCSSLLLMTSFSWPLWPKFQWCQQVSREYPSQEKHPVIRYRSRTYQLAATQTCYGTAYFLFEVGTVLYGRYEKSHMKCSKIYNWLFCFCFILFFSFSWECILLWTGECTWDRENKWVCACVCEQGLLVLGACDREQDCVCVYFSPVCRGIIFNVCVSRLYPKTETVTLCCCHCLVHETPVLNKLNKRVAENQTKAVPFCLFSGRACSSGVYLLITSPIFPQMRRHVPSHAAGLYVRFRKIELTLLILPLSLRATICAAYLDAPPETLIGHIGIHILLLCLT